MAIADINGDGFRHRDVKLPRQDSHLAAVKGYLTATTVTLTSNTTVLVGTPLTFTANVATNCSAPTGTVHIR